MRIERGVQSDCSEAVFRFYTSNPIDVKNIIEGIQRAGEIELRNQGILEEESPILWKDHKGEVPLFDSLQEYENFRFTEKGQVICFQGNDVPNSFIIRVRHDGLKRDTEWTDYIKENDIVVEDAVYSDDLRQYARDCVNSLDYWDDYGGVIDHPMPELEIKMEEVLSHED